MIKMLVHRSSGHPCVELWQRNSVTAFYWFCGLTSSGKYASSCPSSMLYSYNITSSSRTCRCIGTTDLSCHFTFPPIDGCICAEGTYLDESGKCVLPETCPCYDKGSVVPPGQVVNKEGVMWCVNHRYILYMMYKRYYRYFNSVLQGYIIFFFFPLAPVRRANSDALESLLYSHVSCMMQNQLISSSLEVSQIKYNSRMCVANVCLQIIAANVMIRLDLCWYKNHSLKHCIKQWWKVIYCRNRVK